MSQKVNPTHCLHHYENGRCLLCKKPEQLTPRIERIIKFQRNIMSQLTPTQKVEQYADNHDMGIAKPFALELAAELEQEKAKTAQWKSCAEDFANAKYFYQHQNALAKFNQLKGEVK